jgi:hypothetical protein
MTTGRINQVTIVEEEKEKKKNDTTRSQPNSLCKEDRQLKKRFLYVRFSFPTLQSCDRVGQKKNGSGEPKRF